MAVVRAKKQGGCCLFKLFLILVVLAAILIAGVIGTIYWGKTKLESMASPKPLRLVYPVATAEETTAIRMKGAVLPATPGSLPPPKAFTDVELNTLIGNDPEFKMLKGRLLMKIADSKARLLISLPVTFDRTAWETGVDPAGTPYLNAVADMEPDPTATGTLRFKMTGLKFESKAISQDFTDKFIKGFNDGFAKASSEQAAKSGGMYMTFEGNTFVIQPGATTTPEMPTLEYSDIAPPADGSVPAPEGVPPATPAP